MNGNSPAVTAFARAGGARYAGVMRLNLGTHAVVLVALIINLWVGGDLIHAWLGGPARQFFEIILILGYLWFVLGITTPLPWHRPTEDRREDDRRS